jgi:hypothetical protein
MPTLSYIVSFSREEAPNNVIFTCLFPSLYYVHFTEASVEKANIKLRSIKRQRSMNLVEEKTKETVIAEMEDILFSGWRRTDEGHRFVGSFPGFDSLFF